MLDYTRYLPQAKTSIYGRVSEENSTLHNSFGTYAIDDFLAPFIGREIILEIIKADGEGDELRGTVDLNSLSYIYLKTANGSISYSDILSLLKPDEEYTIELSMPSYAKVSITSVPIYGLHFSKTPTDTMSYLYTNTQVSYQHWSNAMSAINRHPLLSLTDTMALLWDLKPERIESWMNHNKVKFDVIHRKYTSKGSRWEKVATTKCQLRELEVKPGVTKRLISLKISWHISTGGPQWNKRMADVFQAEMDTDILTTRYDSFINILWP